MERHGNRRVWLVANLLVLAAFIALAVAAARFPLLPGDVAIGRWVQGIVFPPFTLAMHLMALLSPTYGLVAMAGLAAIVLWVTHHKPGALTLVAFVGVSGLLNGFLKDLIDRPRANPEVLLLVNGGSGSSFPSGHALYAFVCFGLVFYLAIVAVKSPVVSRTMRVVMPVMVVLMGISRIYVGAHWASDVFGAVVLGWLFVATAIVVYRRLAEWRAW